MSRIRVGSSPEVITSRCKIVYRQAKWRVHQFKIISGEELCTVAVLKMNDSLLLWIGNGSNGKSVLDEVALGIPSNEGNGSSRRALATTLVGAEGAAAAMARRLAAALKRPAYVCSGSQFDRFSIPLIEHGLLTEIKSRPDCFY